MLPPGVVCKPCNNVFSRNVDIALIDFPPVRAMAALLEVMHTRRKKLFRDFVPGVGLIPDEPSEVIDVSIDVAPARLILDFRRPTVGRYETDYRPADPADPVPSCP